MFFLGEAEKTRFVPGNGIIDFVGMKEKTQVEVIQDFDIPCCRVAFDTSYNLTVSIHALYTVLTNKIMYPKYMSKGEYLGDFLNKFKYKDNENISDDVVQQHHKFLVHRASERIRKYQSRKYSFKWYSTSKIHPWLINRFHYVDFDKLNENIQQTESISYESLHEKMAREYLNKEELKKLDEVWDDDLKIFLAEVGMAIELLKKKDPNGKNLWIKSNRKLDFEIYTRMNLPHFEIRDKPIPQF